MENQATETRSRILERAWALARERGINNVTIAEIARAAGVSRQLVYIHFTNRTGLLVAMARYHDVESGFRRKMTRSLRLPVGHTLPSLLEHWFDYIPEILPVARALEAAWITGEDGAEAWDDRMVDLRNAFAFAINRLHEAGRLAEGWTVEMAIDWVWAQSNIEIWHYLVIERGWAPEQAKAQMVQAILDKVLRPVASK